MRLREGLGVLWRDRGVVQIGTDPRCGVVVPDLTDDEQALLDLLPEAPSIGDLLEAGRRRLIAEERVRALVATLTSAGVLVASGVPMSKGRARSQVPDRQGDAAYWGRLLPDGDGWSVVSRRAAQVVGVLGAGRVGMLIASGLAAAGVGAVLLADDRPVLAPDVGPGAYGHGDVGRRREEAGAEVLRAVAPQVRTSAPPQTRPDLCVLVEHAVADPVRARPLVREDVVHLSVVVQDVDVLVGPLVVPGAGPCLRCLDLHRCDADERWPAVATQLAALPGPEAESSLAPLAAALAVGETLAHLDDRPPATRGATLEIDAAHPVPRRRLWPTHRECGCAGVRPQSPDPVREPAAAI